MMYSKEQYTELSKRFNSQSFLQKLITIKNNKELFILESDGYNNRLRLLDDKAMMEGLDLLFEFPQFFEYSHLKDIFSFADIKIKEAS